MNTLWYASYGSNLSPRRLNQYIDVDIEILTQNSHWLVGEGQLYAAGRSKKWEGPVLFVDPFSNGTVIYRVYEVSVEHFMKVWAGENDLSVLPDERMLIDRIFDASVSDSVWVDVAGKYDTVYAVHKLFEQPVLTITTSKTLETGFITGDYLDTVFEGLNDAPITRRFRDNYQQNIRSNVEINYRT